MIPAEAIPVITSGTAKQRRNGSPVCQRAITQDRQIEAAAIEADQYRPLVGIIARQSGDKIVDQVGLALFADMPGAEGRTMYAPSSSRSANNAPAQRMRWNGGLRNTSSGG